MACNGLACKLGKETNNLVRSNMSKFKWKNSMQKLRKDSHTYRTEFSLSWFWHRICVGSSNLINATWTNRIFFFFYSMLELFQSLHINSMICYIFSPFLDPNVPMNVTFIAAAQWRQERFWLPLLIMLCIQQRINWQ